MIESLRRKKIMRVIVSVLTENQSEQKGPYAFAGETFLDFRGSVPVSHLAAMIDLKLAADESAVAQARAEANQGDQQ